MKLTPGRPMRYFSLLVISALVTVPARAADPPDTVRMSLDECVKTALDNNLDIAISKKDIRAAELLHDAAHGIFDPLLNVSANSSRQESPSNSTLQGADVLVNERQDASAGLTQLFPSGGTLSLDLTSSRSKTNSFFSSVNPAYNSGLSLSLRHPLLRNFGVDQTRYQIRVTKLGEKTAGKRYQLEIITDLQQVENAYWDMIATRNDLDVAHQSLKVAQDLFAQNKIRVEVGTLAPIELIQAEAGVALREEAIIVAGALLKDTEERLKKLMGLPPDSPLWNQTIVPSDEPASRDVPGSLDDARKSAQEKRAEIKLAGIDREVRKLDADRQRNLARPQLDATATYGYAGLGGDTTIYDADGNPIGKTPGGLGDAWNQVTGTDFPAWSVGLTFSYPIRNRAGKASYASARIAEERADITLKKAQSDVDVDVRQAFRAVQTSRDKVKAARVSREAQQKKLEAEQKKFENGLSTSYQVLTFDEELAKAKSDEERAEIDVKKAIMNLERAMGTYLEAKGLAFEE